MKRLILPAVLAVLLGALLTGGCAYMDVRRPLDVDFDKTELGTKEGQSHARCVLWLVAWGDGGTKAAAEDGGIKIIRHADYEMFVLLFGLYSRMTTVVYGD
jgi:hypothetical protein